MLTVPAHLYYMAYRRTARLIAAKPDPVSNEADRIIGNGAGRRRGCVGSYRASTKCRARPTPYTALLRRLQTTRLDGCGPWGPTGESPL